MCGGRSWLRLHPCLVDYTAVPVDSIPVFLREQLLSLPHTLRVIVVERLSAWVTVVRSGYSQAAQKDNFYATPTAVCGWASSGLSWGRMPVSPHEWGPV